MGDVVSYGYKEVSLPALYGENFVWIYSCTSARAYVTMQLFDIVDE